MQSSKALIIALISFICGVFIASFYQTPELIIYELFLLGIVFGLIFVRHKAIVIFSICLVMLLFGLFRCETAKQTFILQYSKDDGSQDIWQSFEETPQKIGVWQGMRGGLQKVVNQHFSEPQAGFLFAVLLGDQKQISSVWKAKFNLTGIRHIVAVSGAHIVILSGLFFYLALVIGLYRGQAFYFAVVLLWLFIALISFPASAVRAGIMGSLVLFCNKIGRQNSSARVLVYAGFVMLAIDPLLLRWDLGFQLSFLASMGIIYLKPLFQPNFLRSLLRNFLRRDLPTGQAGLRNLDNDNNKKKEGRGGYVWDLLAMTLSAQVFTLPILIYNFGNVSLVAPIANLLIVPFVSVIMALGLAFLLGSLLLPALGFIIALPLWLLITYILFLTEFFSRIAFASVSFHLHWIWIFVFYAILGIFLYLIKKRQREMALP